MFVSVRAAAAFVLIVLLARSIPVPCHPQERGISPTISLMLFLPAATHQTVLPPSNHANFDSSGNRIKNINLPNGTKLYQLAEFDTMFPLAYADFLCHFHF